MVLIQIIAPPEGSRHKPLTDQLDRLGLEYTLVPAHMLTEIPEGYDMQRALAFNTWPLTAGEIGCAVSHRDAALALLESSQDWAVILEDDARIIDPDGFRGFIESLSSASETAESRVITLHASKILVYRQRSPWGWRCSTYPWTALAYALNRPAANELADANRSLCFTADWPLVDKRAFYVWDPNIVSHGDNDNVSLIGDRFLLPEKNSLKLRNVSWRAILHRVRLYSGLHYLSHRSILDGFSKYFVYLIQRRLFFHLAGLLAHVEVRTLGRFLLYPEALNLPLKR